MRKVEGIERTVESVVPWAGSTPARFAPALLLLLSAALATPAGACPGRPGDERPGASARPYRPDWESLDRRPVAEWFQDAKFGIFIHWSTFSVPAWSPKGTYAEWYQYWLETKTLFGNGDFTGREVFEHHRRTYGPHFSYYEFADRFLAEDYDPERWVALFKRAGARYLVITSKHHDGYCLWPSREADRTWGFPWNAATTGPGRDLLGPLAEAARAAGIKFGLYYSLYEWFNPLWKEDKERYVREHLFPQFKDLVERYAPDVVWADGDWDLPPGQWRTPELLAWLFNASSVGDRVVINDRWGKGCRGRHGGYYTTEYSTGGAMDKPWEECRGMGFSFGYNNNEDAEDYASPRALVLLLANIVSDGGNLLLNIGPDRHGHIPAIMQDRLLAMGRWLGVNGEAIYGTRRWIRPCQWSEKGRRDYQPGDRHYVGADFILKLTVDPEPGYGVKEIFFTCKGDTVYAVVPRWPGDRLVVRGMPVTRDTRVRLLGVPGRLRHTVRGGDLVIEVPPLAADELPCRYAWCFEITGVRP